MTSRSKSVKQVVNVNTDSQKQQVADNGKQQLEAAMLALGVSVKAGLKLITPELAAEWLKNKWHAQRPVRHRHVEWLARDMTQGKFHTGPDAILRVEDKLANGQHRLSAVVKSGMAQVFLVLESDDVNLFKIIDAGKGRSPGDVLIEYFPENGGDVASGAKWVEAYQTKLAMPGGGNPSAALRMSREQLFDHCIANVELFTKVLNFIKPIHKETTLIPVSLAIAIYWIAKAAGKEELGQDFLTKVYMGGGENDASGMLRNKLIRNSQAPKDVQLSPTQLFGLSLKALKYLADDVVPKAVNWRAGEEFAVI